MPDEMDRAHRADYEAQRRCREAREALNALLDDERARTLIGSRTALSAVSLIQRLKAAEAHVVAAWD